MDYSEDKVKIYIPDGEGYEISKSALISNSQILPSMIEGFLHPAIHLNLPPEHVVQMIEVMKGRPSMLSSIKDAKELYLLSKIYYIPLLQDVCRKYLIKNADSHNICFIHDFACEQHDTKIQYWCWKKFDLLWMNIFKQEDFLRCKKTTIDRFVSRPRYTSLPEVELFKAVFKWVKTKHERKEMLTLPCVQRASLTQLEKYLSDVDLTEEHHSNREPNKQYRSDMQPFLPNIRFLTMDESDLENFVFKQNILTNDEIQAIRSYFLHRKQNNEYHVVQNFPKSISDSTRKRTEISKIHSYIKRRNLNFKRARPINKKKIFRCEIHVEEDCFLESIDLPIMHYKHSGIQVFFEGFINSPINPLSPQCLICTTLGNIEMEERIFLKKDSNSQLTIKILETEFTTDNSIQIKKEADCFISDEDFNKIFQRSQQEKNKWNIMYCDDVHLYF